MAELWLSAQGLAIRYFCASHNVWRPQWIFFIWHFFWTQPFSQQKRQPAADDTGFTYLFYGFVATHAREKKHPIFKRKENEETENHEPTNVCLQIVLASV